MLLNITNANLILPDEIATKSSLTVEDGVITKIGGCCARRGAVIDAGGLYVMPGMVDIHSDHIEQVIEPRRESVIDIKIALHEQEKQLINQGITTMYHSLTMNNVFAKGRWTAARDEEFAEKIVNEIKTANDKPRLIKHKLHLRFEITQLDGVPIATRLLDEGGVSLLSFMDHTPGQGQYRDIEKLRETLKKMYPNLTEKELDENIEKRINTERLSEDAYAEVANYARSIGIKIASHDDDENKKVDFVKNKLSATISEFPVEIGVARYARGLGMDTVGGAPNVLIGKSHSGNMNAAEGILDGCISILCSDYYPAGMLPAVFKLNREYGLPLTDCVRLVTLSPAEAVGIADRYGSIEEGKNADLVVVDASYEYPAVTAVITEGRFSSMLNYN